MSDSVSEPVVVNFRWTADDVLAARRWHFRHVCRPVFRWMGHCVLLLIMAASLWSLWQERFSWTAVGFLGVGVYFYAIRPFEVRWWTRRQFARRPDSNGEIRWTLSPEGLSTVAPGATSEVQWTAFAKVLATPTGFLFYSHGQIFHFLPRRGFRDEADFQRLAVLAAERVPKLIQMS